MFCVIILLFFSFFFSKSVFVTNIYLHLCLYFPCKLLFNTFYILFNTIFFWIKNKNSNQKKKSCVIYILQLTCTSNKFHYFKLLFHFITVMMLLLMQNYIQIVYLISSKETLQKILEKLCKLRKSCNHKRNINRIYNESLHYYCLQQLSTLRLKT